MPSVIFERSVNDIGGSTPVSSLSAAAVPTQHLALDGVTYAYRELGPPPTGDRPPLLFLHRFRGTLDDWDPGFIDAVARHRRVILFSDAAVGSSTGAPATDVSEKAANAAAFARALGHSVIDALGFSMGGFVAQALALDAPCLVRKVVLVGPGGSPENDPPTDIVFNIALRPDYTFEDFCYLFFAPGREDEARSSLTRLAGRAGDQEPTVGPDVMQAMAGLVMAFMNGETKHFERLADLRQPCLIVSGDTDPFFPMKNQWLLFRELPQAQLAVYRTPGTAPTNSTQRKSPPKWSGSSRNADHSDRRAVRPTSAPPVPDCRQSSATTCR
jgi:pimeloyl-ACP methyl ester carboxylesterase